MRLLLAGILLVIGAGCASSHVTGDETERDPDWTPQILEMPEMRSQVGRVQPRGHAAAIDPEMVICSLDPLIRGDDCFRIRYFPVAEAPDSSATPRKSSPSRR